MRAALILTIVALVGAGTASAQNAECAPLAGANRRVCDAAIDGTRAFHPVAGLLISGGNPVMGTANTLVGLGHFSVTARANAAHVVLPEPGYDGSTGTVPASDEVYAPVPLIEAAAGVYQGLPSGLLSVDLLASAQLLPTGQIDHLAVDEGARRIGDVALGLGYGARVGILREAGPVPAVSVSLMRRDIPTIAYGDLDQDDRFSYAADLHATNLRLVGSKRFAALELAAGLGWDRYTGDARIEVRDAAGAPVLPAVELELSHSRLLAFVNAGVELAALRIVGEAGYQGGRDQELTTEFEDFDTTSGKFFAGLGLRLGW